MAKIGYARVSTRGQNTDSQLDELAAYGCDKIFTDKVTGKLAERPELGKALAYLREGDVFVITRLSQAMRSLKHLIHLAEELRAASAWWSSSSRSTRPRRPAAWSSISSARSTSSSAS
jgi:DNA invertase Pin-like site-specific DNA recombinase